MSNLKQCKQCGTRIDKFSLKEGVCKSCADNNTNYWAQFTNEEE